MLGGKLSNEKIIHKLFSISPSNLAVTLIQNEIQVYSTILPDKKITYNEVYTKLFEIAEKQQEEYIKKSNVYKERSALLCYKCNQKGHFKVNCPNSWYCTICKKEGYSSYRCKYKEHNKQQNENQNRNKTDSFANAFIGMFKADCNSYNATENTIQEENLILDSGASYHCCGLKHSKLLSDV
eukprot:snap_masked-scaffold_39-processed-gene-1.32-mRNA-1 protein AED:1.00 eAED:1.00 QI:0/-1/0/0/-1/1/1/0/181